MDQPVLPSNPSQSWFWILRGFVFMFSIMGNGLVVYLILARTRLIKVISNWFILSLAIADLLLTIMITLPEVILVYFLDNTYPWALKLLYDMLAKTSCYNLCALTFERYVAVVQPLKYSRLTCKTRLIVSIIAGVWILGILSPLPYYICLRLREFVAFRVFMLTFLFVCEVLPTVALVIVYAKMILVVRKQEKMVKRQNKQVEFNYGKTFVQKNRYDKRNRSNIQVLGIILVVFVLCYTISFYKGFVNYVLFREVPSWALSTARILYQVNSAVNGFVYALLKRDIKKEVKKIAFRISNGRFGKTQNCQNSSGTLYGTNSLSLSKLSGYTLCSLNNRALVAPA